MKTLWVFAGEGGHAYATHDAFRGNAVEEMQNFTATTEPNERGDQVRMRDQFLAFSEGARTHAGAGSLEESIVGFDRVVGMIGKRGQGCAIIEVR